MYQYKVSWDQKKKLCSHSSEIVLEYEIKQRQVVFFIFGFVQFFFRTEFVHFSWIFTKIQCIIFTYNVGVNTLHVYKSQEVFIISIEALEKINKCF